MYHMYKHFYEIPSVIPSFSLHLYTYQDVYSTHIHMQIFFTLDTNYVNSFILSTLFYLSTSILLTCI